jgi:hypothetical protein
LILIHSCYRPAGCSSAHLHLCWHLGADDHCPIAAPLLEPILQVWDSPTQAKKTLQKVTKTHYYFPNPLQNTLETIPKLKTSKSFQKQTKTAQKQKQTNQSLLKYPKLS